MDDRKPPPPQSMLEEDSKLPAATMPTTTHETPSKRRKDNAGMAISASAPSGEEVFDVAAQLNFQPGDRIEVKWTINDDDGSEGGEGGNEENSAVAKETNADAADGGAEKSITVWWAATLSGKTDDMHALTDEERSEGAQNCLYKTPSVKVPIYRLNYAPLEELGFDSHSLEDVAFISNKTLLNLSTDEMMTFRKVGEPSPPSSPIPVNDKNMIAKNVAPDESAIVTEFNGQGEIRSFMNRLMQTCLKNTGMDEKMKSLPASEQLVMAERISKAKEGLLETMMKETDKMGTGDKVITADVVRKCMSQMEGGY
eukprot:CAMPEP_0172313176 /NCGR_PEP_ID=MMETSP1058-20130122/19599_1 /TAXON_ID=83371 /ORGANISM="Detonula confervacea, Strain CCMP 353" /LENGTH=311 /DNA_ID=CAMNT_0013026787 /DNA_START=97 /DNA_END=1032 /DNA_ORIENTATION=+